MSESACSVPECALEKVLVGLESPSCSCDPEQTGGDGLCGVIWVGYLTSVQYVRVCE